MTITNQYIILSELFKYPELDAEQQVSKCQNLLDSYYPEAGKLLQPFSKYFIGLSQDQKEELYTKTFDVQPICYLDLGYVIFGEDYKRGTFLMHMQKEQQDLGRDCSPELPDNIYHVLHLITYHSDKDFVDELVAKIIVPGVKKMIGEFDAARVELKLKVLKKLHKAIIQEDLNQGNVYKDAFEALLYVLKSDFSEVLSKAEYQEEDMTKQAFFNRKNSPLQLTIK